ncbi:heme-thiolate peroxidase aromatic peroxygenase [Dacryopinax primogenitus]|uniref:Heme-thiolate peroxidase aromatic peroxygenase n=1 Tax=Dacryopinax primogenitus (strain DJM 731) TaxID=1858805 RepID=M5FYQ1_DACPD|nr:heme-thiolate peroxidase aromatic peroxygenase [Dacryopinax primogenitus]EJU01025.1 heme-thiolate peroxidase aromatic peroxygenase [Dacryopinax primogenitus]
MVNILLNVVSRIILGVADSLWHTLTLTYVMVWDSTFLLLNTFTFQKRRGSLIPPGRPGHGGQWPEWHPPVASDSRSPCPALNAMANHGILPRDGKNIPFRDMSRAIRETYNFAPTFCFFVPLYMARVLGRSYTHGTVNLADVSLHNGIEHDASLLRHDTFLSPGGDQGKPSRDLIDGFFDSVKGDKVTVDDMSQYSELRRADCRRDNSQFSMNTFQKLFSSSNCATFIRTFGGSIPDLKSWLYDERLPEGWEPAGRAAWGVTMGAFQTTVLRIEAGIRPWESMDSAIGDLGGRYGLPTGERDAKTEGIGERAALLPGWKKAQVNGD